MATNKYFRPHSYGQEQRVAEDLVLESIKIHGLDVKYLPRTIVKEDVLLGEDVLSKFENAVNVELYVKNVQGFEGQGDFLSKFNLEIRDTITFTMARKRWSQILTEKLVDEVGYNYQLQSANTSSWGDSSSIILEAGSANGYTISTSRPMEGDLIFLPLNNKIYEIKFVEHENIFYQHGKLYTYDLSCELFEYSSEKIDTGNTAIDMIETTYTLDILNHQVLLETGDALLNEDDGYMLNEFRIETTDVGANNETIRTSALNFIDFSEQSPFSEIDRP